MSRTKRGEKGLGYDYWSRRHPGNGITAYYGKYVKKMTHRYERQQGKQQCQIDKDEEVIKEANDHG